jgi:hypothetical protein
MLARIGIMRALRAGKQAQPRRKATRRYPVL